MPVTILSPRDAFETLELARRTKRRFAATMLDPWYNKGVGGVRGDYVAYIRSMIEIAGSFSDHVFLWGFPEIVARFVDAIPPPLALNCWLSWYYKNTPSVIRGWRSSQMACLHLSRPDAPIYPEHFFNERQKTLKSNGKLRYVPGPPSVIEAPLLVGFVGKDEQTGHPAQKPVAVFDTLYKMVCKPGDVVLDPMCGSATTGIVARSQRFDAILADASDDYTAIAEKRLRLKRKKKL
jgi:site-specific DNA-methyltransferase (adenine-specific)